MGCLATYSSPSVCLTLATHLNFFPCSLFYVTYLLTCWSHLDLNLPFRHFRSFCVQTLHCDYIFILKMCPYHVILLLINFTWKTSLHSLSAFSISFFLKRTSSLLQLDY
jgi:hypothetical protein